MSPADGSSPSTSKTVRSARNHTDPGSRAPHLVSALDHASGTVLGQLQITAKSNEIPAVRDLLDQFDLTDTLVTVNAAHTQTATAEHIVAGGGAYLMTIKPISRACWPGPGRRGGPTFCRLGPWTSVTAVGSPAR